LVIARAECLIKAVRYPVGYPTKENRFRDAYARPIKRIVLGPKNPNKAGNLQYMFRSAGFDEPLEIAADALRQFAVGFMAASPAVPVSRPHTRCNRPFDLEFKGWLIYA
jgi:hypothetical protein